MDMNFPHADVGELPLDKPSPKPACDVRTLLSHAMATQINSPTYKQMMQRDQNGPGQPVDANAALRDMIRYFSGRGGRAPIGSFHPVATPVAGCVCARQKYEDAVYQTASTIGKDALVKSGNTLASKENY